MNRQFYWDVKILNKNECRNQGYLPPEMVLFVVLNRISPIQQYGKSPNCRTPKID